MRIRGLVAVSLGGLAACVPGPDDPQAELVCEVPVEGIDRFTEEAAARGLTPDTSPMPGLQEAGPEGFGNVWAPGRVVVEDLDGDGDVDVLFSHGTDAPQAFRNVGGRFEAVDLALGETPVPDARQPWATFSLAQVAGDDLPDLVFQVGPSLQVAENTGDLSFTELRTLGFGSGPPTAVFSHVWGDPDGDGDLDMWLPTMADLEGDEGANPAPELFFRHHEGLLTPVAEYVRSGEPGLSILANWTDRDDDGDLDLLSFSDRGRELGVLSTAYRNDGVQGGAPVLVEDGPDLGFALPTSAMGLASADLNDDGAMDYCVSDLGPVICLTSHPTGWIEAGAALGLQPPDRVDAPWSGWSLELVDLDHDGWLDMPVVGAAQEQALEFFGTEEEWLQPDAMYRGGPNGFEKVEIGFESTVSHPSMAAADVDGDGFQDLVVAAYAGPALLFMNTCNEGRWLSVRAVGAPGNPQGLGARITVTGERTRTREIQGQRALGQGPARAHFGLGDEAEVDVSVRWPDGAEVELTDVSTRQVLRVSHPDS